MFLISLTSLPKVPHPNEGLSLIALFGYWSIELHAKQKRGKRSDKCTPLQLQNSSLLYFFIQASASVDVCQSDIN